MTGNSEFTWWRSALNGRVPQGAPEEAMALARETWEIMDIAIDNRLERAVGRVVWFLLGAATMAVIQ